MVYCNISKLYVLQFSSDEAFRVLVNVGQINMTKTNNDEL